jgi:hypothetical protein
MAANKESFAPGNKRGRGRPKGSRNQRTLIYEKIVAGFDERLIKVLIAEAGERRNMGAMRILIDRLWPVRPAKEDPVEFALPKQLEDSADILKAGPVIRIAVSGPRIGPSRSTIAASSHTVRSHY